MNLTPTPLAAGNHTLRVSYRPVAGSYHGDAVYQGLVLDSGAHTSAPPDVAEDSSSSSATRSPSDSVRPSRRRTAYGWLVGERLGAEHTQIAQGGACLVATADGCVGLSDQFLKTGASRPRRTGTSPATRPPRW